MRVRSVEHAVLIGMMPEDAVRDVGHVLVGTVGDAASARGLAEETRPDIAVVDLALDDGATGGFTPITAPRRS